MSNSIRLSPKHGVNPSVMLCFYCGEAKGVALPGMLKGDREAPRQGVWDQEPCGTCKRWMEQGVICIEVDEAKTTDEKNPWRSGGWAVIKDEAVQRLPLDAKVKASMLKRRVAFLTSELWDLLGFPRENINAQD